MIARLRSAAYQAGFYTISVPFVLGAPLVGLAGRRPLQRYTNGWVRVSEVLAHRILGIRVRVEGAPLDRPALYAAKHQSMFETLLLARLLDGPAIVMKQELSRIPVWGSSAQRYGLIAIDRAGSSKALRAMIASARAALAEGRPVLLFPEGTRVAPGESPPLQAGLAGLYRALDVPVVPIALDTGRLWPRKGPKRPGVVTLRFGAPIPPGLPRKEAEARIHAGINALEPRAG